MVTSDDNRHMTDGHPTSAPLLPEELPNQAPVIAADRRLADRLLSADLHPEKDRLAGRRPYPTLVFRFIAVAGLAALVGLVGLATYEALRDSDWEQPRPILDSRAAVAALAMALGGVLWGVFAALNARRAGIRDVVHPLVLPVVAAAQVGSWFAVERIVTGDQRRTAWAIWLACVLVAHFVVAVMYRSTAAVLGETYSQFSLIAWLPLFAAGVGVASTYTPGAVFGLPMVVALALWLVVEGYLAMAGWDRECRFRITGVDPSAKPMGVQFEAEVSKAQARGEVVAPARESFHHTLLPRAMVLAALVLGLTLPAWVILLEHKGHVQVSGIDTTIDAEAGRLLTGLALASIVTYALGWLWWSMAAALNAASSSRWSVPVWSAPVGYVVSLATVAAAGAAQQHADSGSATVIVIVAAVVVAAAHFAVLRAYRRTAEAIGGSVAAWTRVIAVPLVAIGFSIIAAFLSSAIGDAVFERVMQASWIVFYGFFAISLHSAMASFDRACRGAKLSTVRFSGVPDFLKRRGSDADSTT